MDIGIKSLRCLITLSQHAITILPCCPSSFPPLRVQMGHFRSIGCIVALFLMYISTPLHLELNEISTGMPIKKL